MSQQLKYLLDEEHIPRSWYHIQADLPEPLPAILHPGTGKPIQPADLAPLFPMALIEQEVSQERHIEIPGRCGTSTVTGGLRRCSGPAVWSGHSRLPRGA
jgi:predicted alternative tryptophan synthase beta-subunit